MILPERTVDAWTAAYITGRRWRARLWAPTERAADERYDLGVGLGKVGGVPGEVDPEPWPDKVFALEHKGVYERGATKEPVIWIRLRQLLIHLAADRARGGNLVYYLLPDAEWPPPKAPYGTMPAVAARRTPGPTWNGFQVWACVAHVEDLLAMLASIAVADASRFKYRAASGGRLDDWQCGLSTAELWAIPNALNLRDFISAVRDCTRGRLVADPAVSGPPPPGAPGPPDVLGPDATLLAEALELDTDIDLDDVLGSSVDGDDTMDEAFDRPSFFTFCGVGDRDTTEERE